MNVGAILDYVAGKLDAQVIGYMQEYGIPASLMDKTLDRIQSHVRQIKAEEYSEELMDVNLQLEELSRQKEKTEEGTVEEFKEKMGIKKGGKENANIQRKAE